MYSFPYLEPVCCSMSSSNCCFLWTMLCRAIQDGQVMLESSGKKWPTGEGNGKPLQYSCLENPMNSMKRQKDRTLKDELPWSVGPSMILEINREITPERMKRWSQSKNSTQLWMGLMMEVKSDAMKSNIAWGPGTLGPWISANWKWSNKRLQEWTSTL